MRLECVYFRGECVQGDFCRVCLGYVRVSNSLVCSVFCMMWICEYLCVLLLLHTLEICLFYLL